MKIGEWELGAAAHWLPIMRMEAVNDSGYSVTTSPLLNSGRMPVSSRFRFSKKLPDAERTVNRKTPLVQVEQLRAEINPAVVRLIISGAPHAHNWKHSGN